MPRGDVAREWRGLGGVGPGDCGGGGYPYTVFGWVYRALACEVEDVGTRGLRGGTC